MSTAVNSDQIAQRLVQCNLATQRELAPIFSQFGTNIDSDAFQTQLLRRELITNWQLDRILGGHITGYFYGKFKVLYLVGAGTFARVYRAEDTSVEEKDKDIKAVKVLRSRYTADLETKERFMQEAATVKKLRHPNIVPIYEIGDEKGRLYMVMDFVQGQNLRDYVRIHKRLELQTALKIAHDIASGLTYAAEQTVTHRDLKLSNVLLASTGRASLVDFGLAAVDQINKGDDAISSPRSIDYAGLERATGVRRDDKRSDIFFLGTMLYHMICGKPALFETRERVQRLSVGRYKDITPITDIMPKLPHRVVVLLHRLMMINPEERVQTPARAMTEIKAVMESIEQGDLEAYSPRSCGG